MFIRIINITTLKEGNAIHWLGWIANSVTIKLSDNEILWLLESQSDFIIVLFKIMRVIVWGGGTTLDVEAIVARGQLHKVGIGYWSVVQIGPYYSKCLSRNVALDGINNTMQITISNPELNRSS